MNTTPATKQAPGMWLLTEDEIRAVSGGAISCEAHLQGTHSVDISNRGGTGGTGGTGGGGTGGGGGSSTPVCNPSNGSCGVHDEATQTSHS
jgi:hypothetical protein